MSLTAAILSIGDELALGQNVDTNSAWLSQQLIERAIVTREHRTVDDDRERIATAIAALAGSHDVLLMTGGLGPTSDDLTREALSDAIGPAGRLVEDPEARQQLDLWFTAKGRTMPAMNARQALRPASMRCLPNPHGTAPGLIGRVGACIVASLPGPPREMKPMFTDHVVPALPRSDGAAVLTASVAEFGMGESVAAEKLGSLMDRARNPMVGTTASDSIVTARIRAEGGAEAMQQAVAETLHTVERAWAPYAFSTTHQSLAEVVIRLLGEKDTTLATAESCTGGWLAKSIVDVPGASDWYKGGWVTYSNELKERLLGVAPDTLASHGAVSVETGLEMAEGARRVSRADIAVAITGVAGPGGGTPEKPVGTVCIAIAHEGDAHVRRFEFTGDRATIRDRSVKAALQMLRFDLLGVDRTVPMLWQVFGSDARRHSPSVHGVRSP